VVCDYLTETCAKEKKLSGVMDTMIERLDEAEVQDMTM
jgi:hypothetical protein